MTRGFVYVATGAGYLEEARVSAGSLRRHHPGVPICLITDRPVPSGPPFDHVITCADAEHKPVDKLLAWRCPFEHVVFLDTDTWTRGDLGPLFEVLARFDLAALQDVNRGWNYELPGVPLCFSEFNTGVIAFRKSDRTAEFFKQWRANYDELNRRLGLVNDQPAFRLTVYQSELRVAPVPSEFHFLADIPNAATWKVRLLHGRGDLRAIGDAIDAELGGRTYVPHVGVVSGFHGRVHALKTALRTAGRWLRLALKPPPDTSATHPRRWWLSEERAARERSQPAPRD